jgi:hypothetical protein
MLGDYTRFFSTLRNLFEPPSQSYTLSYDAYGDRPRSLEVVKVGNYLCSLAASPDDVLNLDTAVFGKPVGLREVLEKVLCSLFLLILLIFVVFFLNLYCYIFF